MKFHQIAHYDTSGDETIFWVDISDPPPHIENEAIKIDGDEYGADCFGMCASYDPAKNEYTVVTETDPATGDARNLFYIDNDGNKTWFKAEIPNGFLKEVFTACKRIISDSIRGYVIKRHILFENDRGFALAENPEAVQPFVTWQFTLENGTRDFYWGHYFPDRDTAVKDYERRITEYHDQYGLVEKNAYRYYSTQRPVDIGSYPKTENGPVRFENFESRRYIEREQFSAWGCLVYDAPLSEKQMSGYELRPSRDNADLKEQIRQWAQTVGKWERAHRVPDVKRLTWWYSDYGVFVAKDLVPPEHMKKQYDGVVAANARAAEKRAAARENKKKEGRGGDAR